MQLKMKPVSVIKAELGIEPNGRVQKKFVDACANHMDKYVPIDSGDLSTIITKGANYIKYEQPYAHYQWAGISKSGKPLDYSNSHEKHQYAGDHWEERMKSAEMTDVMKEVRKYVRRHS